MFLLVTIIIKIIEIKIMIVKIMMIKGNTVNEILFNFMFVGINPF